MYDLPTSPLPDADKALLAYVDKVNLNPSHVCQDDVDDLKRVGWSDEAIYDAVTVCACSISTTAGLTAPAYTTCPPLRTSCRVNG